MADQAILPKIRNQKSAASGALFKILYCLTAISRAWLERGLEHYEYFIESIREGKPSRENAEEGHFAAGAAHLGNMAYRRGKKMKWDRASGKVSEA